MRLLKRLEIKGLLNRREFLKSTTNRSFQALFSFSILSNFYCKSKIPAMPKRILGRTNLSVSLLGFGCTQVKDKAVYQHAVDLGINYFHMGDRDPTYNLDACEALLPYRKKIIIAYMSHPKPSKVLLLEDLDNFLKQSGIEYLDIWFVITPNPQVLGEFNEAVKTVQQAGKIRYAGISTHNLNRDVTSLISSHSIIDVVMMSYNYLSPPADGEVLTKLYDSGLGITVMKPLAGKFYENTTSQPGPLLRWLASDNRIHTIPVIMNTIEQVEQNVAAIKQSITVEDHKILKTMFSYNSQRFCRMCGTCVGKCPKELAVSDLIRTAMYLEGYKDEKLARSNFLIIPEKKRKISCDTCEQCSVICPHGVAIPARIFIIKQWLS
jgi:predicted aldo/keto reductase-like oxidoreductase